ncbi:16022_t:CDS:1 [Racocetra fulgida]|uniref:16022_t:CDS:1 n=1 Tax=Racocetra fulgida TaxID=60492 RepID=A0A9N9C2T2_9GLOM|nr:16022_t:CDS:1 [Racocetra fulgida]
MLLIKLFSPPKSSSQCISLEFITPVSSFNGNEPNTSSLVEKDDSRQDIILNNRNDNQDIHLVHLEPVHLKDPSEYSSLDLSPNYLNQSTSSDPLIGSSINNQINQTNVNNRNNTRTIDISTREVGDDEPSKRVSEGLAEIFSSPQEVEMLKQILKKL